ncbi:MAG: DUF512 domain-containing protein, partial [Candidatus Sumerlaeota bacterium]|nr:DUF512 domain-containing protein [Candidatus Sumerlaeota bacterium]
YARRLIESTMPLRKRLARHIGEDIVYLSDEIYFLAGEPLLDYSRRNYWRQIENGVGMVHEFYKNFRLARWPGLIRSSKLKSAGVFGSPEKFPRQAPLRIAFVTGGLGKIVLERLLESLNRIPGITAQALVARNTLFGDSVTVSGLLGGTDILRTIQRRLKEFDLFLLPPNCLRSEDHLFLDDLSLEQLRAQTGADVRIAYQNAQEILWEIKKM